MAHVISKTAINTIATTASSAVVVDRRRSLVPQAWEKSVRKIGLAECEQAGVSLAHAFAADALSMYLLDGDGEDRYSDETKWKLHVRIMTYLVSAHCYSGVVTTIGPDYDAVALWMPPGMHMDDWWTIFRSGMWRLYYQLGSEGRKRYYEDVLPLLHETMDEVMGDREYYYLAYIGTKPSARGKGYAKKLIMDMAAKADAEDRAMYLESSSRENISYYERFGFEYRKEISFKRGPVPVPLFIMVREPVAKPAVKGVEEVATLSQIETVKV
ncbi:Acetyltransferase [Trichoderma simmonsii]|uniref:Acetyltransferase n=1 Tax=Trichoderma simmonsii TaxID=1491479 RepID=A0A8G0PAR1_9HYPO|nr:Acetyltransferase [Trichoderma simmonsii]